jgi:hypothetical protein
MAELRIQIDATNIELMPWKSNTYLGPEKVDQP